VLLTPAATLRSPAAELSDRPVALHGEALNHPLLRYPALLRGRGQFAAKVDLVQRGVEQVWRDVKFVGCVGAEPEDVGGLARSLLETGGFRPQIHTLDREEPLIRTLRSSVLHASGALGSREAR
jgi:hypothetical protein